VFLLWAAAKFAVSCFSASVALCTAVTSLEACLVRLLILLMRDRTKAENIKKHKPNKIFRNTTYPN
jgi:hypothetical protein